MPRKPHPSSVLKNLPDEDQEALFEFLRGKSLADGVKWLFSNNGVRTNDSSLSEWRGWYETTQQVASWESDAQDFKALLVQSGTDDDLAAKIAEARFLAQATKQNDAQTFVKVMSVIERYKSRKASEKAHAENLAIKKTQTKQRDEQLKIQAADLDRKNKELQSRLDELQRQRQAAEDAMTKAKKEGGMTEDTVRIVRAALGMSTDDPAKP